MTQITVVRDQSGDIIRISARNHTRAGRMIQRSLMKGLQAFFSFAYRDRSQGPVIGNIVCASITTVFEQLETELKDFFDNAIRIERSQSEIFWNIEIPRETLSQAKREQFHRIVGSSLDVLSQIENTYPDLLLIEEKSAEL